MNLKFQKIFQVFEDKGQYDDLDLLFLSKI